MSLPIEVDSSFTDASQITKVRPSRVGKLDVAQTTAYKKTLVFESKLQKILGDILDTILKTGQDITQIRFAYNQIVYDYWRGAIHNVYMLGINYTNDAHNKVPFPTDQDNKQVRKLTDYATSVFFLKIEKYLRREQEIENSDYFFSVQDSITKMIKETPTIKTGVVNVVAPKKVNVKSLSIDKQINNLVTTILFMTLNIAVVQKTRQLLNLRNKDQTVALSGNPITDFFGWEPVKNVIFGLSTITNLFKKKIRGIAEKFTEEPPVTGYLMWVTEQDDKVCFKYCEPLDGEKFDASDTNHPIPIISSHPNCRCRLLSVDANGNVLADGVDAI